MNLLPLTFKSISQSLHIGAIKSITISLIVLLFIFLPDNSSAQSYDLTGYWQSDAGGCYQIRQNGNEVIWAGSINVFHGAIAGNYCTGLWYDLPSKTYSAFGESLSIRIENNNRFIKVSESINYRGSIWTRINGPCNNSGTQLPVTSSNNGLIGPWDIKCCNNSLSWILTITNQEGNMFSGSFSGGAGDGNVNGQLNGNIIEFDRTGGWGKQHWTGQIVQESGGIRMINGTWTGDYLSNYLGQNNWHAEKK